MSARGEAVADEAPIALEAAGLAVRVAGVERIAPSSFFLRAGERALLVGASGSGKSLFLDLLLGFARDGRDDVETVGSLDFEGRGLLGRAPEAHAGLVGAVFQLHALGLFDDLTMRQNLLVGTRDEAALRAVAADLGLEALHRRTTACSGGERMRVAMGRTVLAGGRLLVYDEPTTGLDPAAESAVVAAVQTAHRHVSLVVTHDPERFLGWADVALVLDPLTRRIERKPATAETLAEWSQHIQASRSLVAPLAKAEPRRRVLGAGWLGLWPRLAGAVGGAAFDALSLLRLPLAASDAFHPVHGPRLRRTLARDVAPGVVLFAATSAALVALTSTFFLFDRLPKREWTAPLVQDDLVAGLGLIATRIGVPLLVSILLAAKLGASTSAHLGHMSLTRQVDALRLLAIDPRRHLLVPSGLGLLLAAWVAMAFCWVASTLVSLVVFLAMHPGWSAPWFLEEFVREVPATTIGWVLAKTGLAALAVAVVAYRRGIAPKRRPEQVVGAIHGTLLVGLLLVVLVHAVFAFLEF